MIIRPQQIEAMSKAMTHAFEERMVAMVSACYPQRAHDLQDQQLRAIVHSGINRADQYGINLTHDVERFIRLMFRFRFFNFEEDPPTAWTQDILTDQSLTAEAKLDRVEGQASLFQLIVEE